jgi:hypothetical protein
MTLDDRSASSERERDALEFMRRGRKLRGFSPTQVRRVESRLMEQQRPARRRIWLPRLAVVCLALLAGSAVAAVLDLSRVPLIGSLLPSSKSADTSKLRRTRPTPSRPSAAPTELKPAAAPSTPTPAPNPPLPAASAPEVPPSTIPPSPLPASQPTRTLGARPSAERGSPVAQLRLAARAPEATEPRPRLPSSGRVEPTVLDPTAPVARPAPVEPLPAPTLAPRPWPNTTSTTSTTTPPPPPEDPVLAESRSFSAAVGRWHLGHDAKAALTALDGHQRRFPGGRLSLEATLLRAEILLQLGREPEVLHLLDGVSLAGLPRGRELQTVRGELRIKHGRCAEGRGDLDEVLAKDASDSFGRRAAHAISVCPCNDRIRCRHLVNGATHD